MTEAQATELIGLMKRLLVDTINFPSPGEKLFLDAVHVLDESKQFEIVIRKGSRDSEKCTFQGLSKNPKVPLVRLDVVSKNGPPHRNPDDTLIYGPHLHIYKDGTMMHEAVPFDIEDPDLVSYCICFFKKFNIIELETLSITNQPNLLN